MPPAARLLPLYRFEESIYAGYELETLGLSDFARLGRVGSSFKALPRHPGGLDALVLLNFAH